MIKFTRSAVAAATLLLAAGAPMAGGALAQTMPIKMASYNKGYFKGFNSVVLPTYNLTFITASQATAVGGGARARLNKVMVGVNEAKMRQLADEAHADLRAQFVAAGIPVASDEVAAAMVATNAIPLQPGNRAVINASGGITINTSVRQSSITVGATAAPMLASYAPPVNVMALTPINNRLPKGQPDGTMAVIPTLVLDFANVGAEVSSGRNNTASAGGDAAFSIRGVASGTFFAKVFNGGKNVFAFYIRPESDSALATPFGLDAIGAASVMPMSPMGEAVARGDAVVINVPVWEGLVRNAYKSHNASIVKAALAGK